MDEIGNHDASRSFDVCHSAELDAVCRTVARLFDVPSANATLIDDTTVWMIGRSTPVQTALGDGLQYHSSARRGRSPRCTRPRGRSRFADSDQAKGGGRVLMLDLRSFQIVSDKAEVAFSAKIVSGDGKILAMRVFDSSAPTLDARAPAANEALNVASGTTARDLAA